MVLRSIEQRMVQGLFVPDALFVENEDLSRELVLEDHLWVEHVSLPHQRIGYGIGRYFLKVIDVDDIALGLAEEEGFMENDLLVVGQQLCVPAEVALDGPSARDEQRLDQCWQHEEVEFRRDHPKAKAHSRNEVLVTPFQSVVSLVTLVQENAILVSLHSIELRVVVDHIVSRLRAAE